MAAVQNAIDVNREFRFIRESPKTTFRGDFMARIVNSILFRFKFFPGDPALLTEFPEARRLGNKPAPQPFQNWQQQSLIFAAIRIGSRVRHHCEPAL